MQFKLKSNCIPSCGEKFILPWYNLTKHPVRSRIMGLLLDSIAISVGKKSLTRRPHIDTFSSTCLFKQRAIKRALRAKMLCEHENFGN